MLTNYNSPAERRPEHELCEERRKSAVQVLFSAQAFLVVFFFHQTSASKVKNEVSSCSDINHKFLTGKSEFLERRAAAERL